MTSPTLPNADELEVVARKALWDVEEAAALLLLREGDRATTEKLRAAADGMSAYVSSAQAQIDALQEANEALMMERTSLIETKRGQIEMLLSTIDRCRIDAFVATAKAETSAVEMDRLLGLIDQHGSAKLIRLSGGTSNG